MEPYRRLVETSPDGILLAEKERITFANASAANLFGVSRTDELVGRSIFEFFPIEQHPTLRQVHKPLARGGNNGSS